VLALGLATRAQLAHWHDDETLFAHALRVGPPSRVAHLNYANAIDAPERRAEQVAHFRRALELAPGDALAHYDLGRVLALQGQREQAIAHYRASLAADPAQARAWNNLGNLLLERGDRAGAERAWRRALDVTPDHPAAHFNLALQRLAGAEREKALAHARAFARGSRERPRDLEVLARRFAGAGDLAGARRLLALRPDAADARLEALDGALAWQLGDEAAALAALERAHALAPDVLDIANDLAWYRVMARDPALRDVDAAWAATDVLRRAGAQERDAGLLDTLAAVHAARGEFEQARALALRAAARARRTGRVELARAIEVRAAGYAAGHMASRERTLPAAPQGAAAADAARDREAASVPLQEPTR